MLTLSATCLAIACAARDGHLRIVEREGRFGAFWAIEDARGVIEVALSAEEAEARVASIAKRAA